MKNRIVVFAGQYYDDETELHYNRFRFYEIQSGRYTKIDPIGFYGGDENLYRYVYNNPIGRYDNLGLYDQWDKFIKDPRVRQIWNDIDDYQKMDLFEEWKKERRCKYGGCVNPYIEHGNPGEIIMDFIGDTKIDCDWDEVKECSKDKVKSTSKETIAHCVEVIITRGRNQQAWADCTSETIVGIGECITENCDISNCNISK